MDTIIKTTLALFIILLAAFSGFLVLTLYPEAAYQNSVAGTYTYTCTITTDSSLSNVTFFIPVPADPAGNSPMDSAFSSRTMNGVPADWDTALFDTGKATLLKVMTPAIIPPEGTSAQHPYMITFSKETTDRTPINTTNPVDQSAMFRPVQALNETTCPPGSADSAGRCFTYTTPLYADYHAVPTAIVTITADVKGKNTWTIFEPRFNEYTSAVGTKIHGENHGWVFLEGELTSGTGTYDIFPDTRFFR